MEQVYKIDENGYYTGPTIVDVFEPTDGSVEIPPPNGLYRAKWTGTEWVEDMLQGEIDELNNQPKEPTEIEVLQQENESLSNAITEITMLISMIFEGGI